jgi:hypothetical protein
LLKEQLAAVTAGEEVEKEVDASEYGSDGVGEIYSDIVFEVDNTRMNAHRVVVFARCTYLRGLVSMLERQAASESATATDVVVGGTKSRLVIPIEGVRQAVFQALLLYLYTDRIEVPPHRLAELAEIAEEYGLSRLQELCERRNERASMLHLSQRPASGPVTPPPPSSFGHDMLQALKAGVQAGEREARADARAALLAQAQAKSRIHRQEVSSAPPVAQTHAPVVAGLHNLYKIQTGVLACADVCFLLPASSLSSRELSPSASNVTGQTTKIWAHRVILCRSEYFRVLLSGNFREGSQRVVDLRPLIQGYAADPAGKTGGAVGVEDEVTAVGGKMSKLELEQHLQSAAAAAGGVEYAGGEGAYELQEQGLSGWCFAALLHWAYTGSREMVRKLAGGQVYNILGEDFGTKADREPMHSVDGDEKGEEEGESGDGARQVMELLVAAVQTGFEDLAQCCEQMLAHMLVRTCLLLILFCNRSQ